MTTISLCGLIGISAYAAEPDSGRRHDVTRNILRGGSSEKYVKDTLCEGYQYVFGGKKYTKTGVYQDTVIENGKEEVYTLDLVVLPPSDTTYISDTNNQGETYQKNGFNISSTEEGTHYYFLDLENKAGCDSVVCLVLTTKKEKDYNSGTILFKEDFGGNSVDDPIAKTEGIAQCSYNYNENPKGGGNYAIRKVGWDHNQWYYPIYDHTYPDDGDRGYLMQVDGAGDNGVFYQTQIDGLCANMELYLSMWGMSSTKTSGWNDANLELIVEDLHGNILASKEVVLVNQKGYWEQFGLTYVTPKDETSIIYKIRNSSSSSSGNDFMIDDIEVRLATSAAEVPEPDTICVGENLTLSAMFENGGTYQEPIVYAWYRSDKRSYNTSDWKFVSYGKDFSINNIKESDAGYYKVWIGSYGSTNINTMCNAASNIIELNVKNCGSACKKDLITLRDTITLGDSYQKNGFTINDAVIGEKAYKLELTNAQGCDSIVTLYLKVVEPVTCMPSDTTIYETICEGESYSFDGKALTEGGVFTKKFTKTCSNGNTTDSTVTLNLTVSPKYDESVIGVIYVGESYQKYGFNVEGNTAGKFEYKQELLSSMGCDSIISLTLTVKEMYTQPEIPVPSAAGTYTVVYDGNGATSGQMDKHVYTIGADEATQLDANKYEKVYNVKFDTQGGSHVDGIQSSCEFIGWLQDEFLTSTTNYWSETWTNVFPQYTKISNDAGINVVNVSTQPSIWERLYSHPVYMPEGDHVVKFSFCSPTGYFDCTTNPNLDEPASRLKLAVCSAPQTSNSTDRDYLTNGTDYSYVIFKQYDPTTTMKEQSLILYSTGGAAYFAFNCGNLRDSLDIELRVSPLTLYINGESFAVYNDMANTTELVREETGNVTLKAQWENKSIITPFAPTKEGYTFSEWNTKPDGTGDSYAESENVVISSDTTLYAIWVKDNTFGGDPDTPGNKLLIPTAFTPHSNDGMNDVFMKGYEVYIYDRYGNLITHSTDGWDGTYRGETATPGVYVYVLKFEDNKGIKEEKGTIEIVKAK